MPKITENVWEPHAGGRIHVSLDFDGRPYEVHGTFLVVDPPHRLTYRWDDDDVIDVTIESREGGSRLRLEHTFAAAEHRPFLTGGWSYALDRLGRV